MKQRRNQKLTKSAFYLTLMLLAVGGILTAIGSGGGGGGGGGGETGPPLPTNLVITVQDNADDQAPVADVIISVYETDDVTINQTIITGVNGVADFGELGRDRATITIAWINPPSNLLNFNRRIQTYVNVTLGNLTYFTEYPSENFIMPPIMGSNNGNIIGSVDVALTYDGDPIADGVDRCAIKPIDQSESGSPPITMPNTNVYEGHLLDNGNLSLFAGAYDDDRNLVKYGVLENTVFVGPGAVAKAIHLDKNPRTITWEVQNYRPVGFMIIDGILGKFAKFRFSIDQLMFFRGTLPIEESARIGTLNGSFNFINDDLNVDLYAVQSWDYIMEGGSDPSSPVMHMIGQIQNFQSVPDTLQINIPDMLVRTFTNNSGVFSWTVTGDMDNDAFSVFRMCPGVAPTDDYSWEIVVSGDSTTVSEPELPDVPAADPVSSWYVPSSPESVFTSMIGFSTTEGFDEFWAVFSSGDNPITTGTTEVSFRSDGDL